MKEDVLKKLVGAPAQLNIMPHFSVDAVCGYIDLLHEESFPILEILGRPMDDALELLAQVNERPQRAKVFMAVGTVRTRDDAKRVVELKPDFVVSGAFSRRVLDVTVEAGIPYVPAISTLQDIQNVLDAFEDVGRELKVLKVCPADMTNIYFLSMYAGIFPGISFCPTGNIRLEDIPAWKAMPWMGAPMERWFIADELIHAEDWEAIRTRLREIKELARQGESQREN